MRRCRECTQLGWWARFCGVPLLSAACLLTCMQSIAQDSAGIVHEQALPPEARRSYKLIRSDEDWSFLKDQKLRTDLWDPVKYIPFSRSGSNRYLTLSGEIRYVREQIGNDNWGEAPYQNGYLTQRYMFGIDSHFGDHARAFLQLKSGLEEGRRGGPRPIDEKKLDFNAGFLDLSRGTESKSVTLRVGREELDFGGGRFVAVREGPNVRQSFDGFRIIGHTPSWRINGFAVRPDQDNPDFFNNAPISSTSFWGLYTTRLLQPGRGALDTYYLGIDRKAVLFNRGSGRESRHTLGVRYARLNGIDGHVAKLAFDYEAAYQFGSFSSGDIRAWTIASDTEWTPGNSGPIAPHLGFKADVSSGDDPRRSSLGTFNPYFPVGNYFGVLATTGPGPINFRDLHPSLGAEFAKKVTLTGDWVLFWRQSLRDGVYGVSGSLIRPSGDATARFVGHRPGLEARWQIDRHAYVQADYGVFFAGPFLRQSRPGRNLDYAAFWAGYKF